MVTTNVTTNSFNDERANYYYLFLSITSLIYLNLSYNHSIFINNLILYRFKHKTIFMLLKMLDIFKPNSLSKTEYRFYARLNVRNFITRDYLVTI